MTVTKSNFELKQNNFYPTPEWATQVLFCKFNFHDKVVWEPCAGNHDIVRALNSHVEHSPKCIITSDICEYDAQHDLIYDFFSNDVLQLHADYIITNPPYGPSNRLADKFVRTALERYPNSWLIVLLTSKFDHGKTRTDLFRHNSRFLGQIKLLNRVNWFKGKYDNSECHSWFVWTSEKDSRNKHHYPITEYYGKNDVQFLNIKEKDELF